MVSGQHQRSPATSGSASNFANADFQHVQFTSVGGRKLPRSTRIAFFRNTSLG